MDPLTPVFVPRGILTEQTRDLLATGVALELGEELATERVDGGLGHGSG